MSKKSNTGFISRGRNTRGGVKMLFTKQKKCPICKKDSPKLDYKNPQLLEDFVSECGRILPSRITNVCAKHQRSLKTSIKRGRMLAILAFVSSGKR